MQTETVRLNITMPKDLLESLNQISGSRSRSRIISESLREYIRQKKKSELEEQMEEGYRVSAKESMALAAEFEAVDLEGWDEY